MQYLRRHWSEMYRRHRPEHQTVPRIYPQRLVGRPVQPVRQIFDETMRIFEAITG